MEKERIQIDTLFCCLNPSCIWNPDVPFSLCYPNKLYQKTNINILPPNLCLLLFIILSVFSLSSGKLLEGNTHRKEESPPTLPPLLSQSHDTRLYLLIQCFC